MPKTRVVVADDHAVLRSGLRLLINTQPDMEVIGEADSFPATFNVCEQQTPDVVTLDLNMPGGSGGRAISELKRVSPKTRVLVLTMHDDPSYLRAALAAGADGYIVKKAADTELLTAIRTVVKGRAYVNVTQESAAIPPISLDISGASRDKNNTPLDSLSDRERQVLMLVAQGYTNQAIADKIYLSVKTIESYRSRLMVKLGLQSRADLMRLAIETGLLNTDSRTPPGFE